MTKRELYEKVYGMLDDITPLRTDCGELCSRACCASSEDESGMYLFPGEEEMYTDRPSWLRIEKSAFTFGNGKPVHIAICNENCQRFLRPLACRIFPLTPYIDRNKSLIIKADSRAVPLCPLARETSTQQLDENFIRTVANAFRILIKDNEIRSFILSLSRLMDEQEDFILRMTGNQSRKKRSRATRRR